MILYIKFINLNIFVTLIVLEHSNGRKMNTLQLRKKVCCYLNISHIYIFIYIGFSLRNKIKSVNILKQLNEIYLYHYSFNYIE